MSPGEEGVPASCHKRPYRTRRAAINDAIRIVCRGLASYRRSYYCGECAAFHLTKKKKANPFDRCETVPK